MAYHLRYARKEFCWHLWMMILVAECGGPVQFFLFCHNTTMKFEKVDAKFHEGKTCVHNNYTT